MCCLNFNEKPSQEEDLVFWQIDFDFEVIYEKMDEVMAMTFTSFDASFHDSHTGYHFPH